jgi:hypothetical protein
MAQRRGTGRMPTVGEVGATAGTVVLGLVAIALIWVYQSLAWTLILLGILCSAAAFLFGSAVLPDVAPGDRWIFGVACLGAAAVGLAMAVLAARLSKTSVWATIPFI